MTLIKSMLLGSAAAIVAVAAAQAADLPTRKAAPVQYVQICNVGGITGWVLPGSDTCVKLSGYITGQFVGGNLNDPVQLGRLLHHATHCPRSPPVSTGTYPANGYHTIVGGIGALPYETIMLPAASIPSQQCSSPPSVGFSPSTSSAAS